MTKLRGLFLGIFMLICSIGMAQNMTSVQYNVGIPMGDLGDYIEKTSFRGFSIDYQYMLTNNVALGFGIGWQVFYEDKGFSVVEQGSSTISGYQYRYTNSFPGHFTATYFLDEIGNVKPYAGLGIGVVYDERSTDVGLYAIETDAWHFSLRPEVGLQFEVNYNFAVRLNARYVQGFNTNDLDGQNYLALGVGFVFIR